MVGQARDLGHLQAAGVPFDPPGQQPRRDQTQGRTQPQVDQQSFAGPAEQGPHRRVSLADRGDGQHLAVGGQERHLADQAVGAVDVGVAEPGPAFVGPAGAQVFCAPIRDGSDDARTVPSGPRISARLAPDSATARSTSGASVVRRDRLRRVCDPARSAWTPCSRRRRSCVGRGPHGTRWWTGPLKLQPQRPEPRRRPPTGTPGTARPGCAPQQRRRPRPSARFLMTNTSFASISVT